MFEQLQKLLDRLKPKPEPPLEELERKRKEQEDREIINRIYHKLRSTPKGAKRILVLDKLVDRPGLFPPSRLPADNKRLELLFEGDLVKNLGTIDYSADLDRRLRLLLTIVGADAFDCIIIGNNSGNGVWKAELIGEVLGSEVLYAKTIVVWNDSFPREDGSTEYANSNLYRGFEDDKFIVNPELFTDRKRLDNDVYAPLGLEPLTNPTDVD